MKSFNKLPTPRSLTAIGAMASTLLLQGCFEPTDNTITRPASAIELFRGYDDSTIGYDTYGKYLLQASNAADVAKFDCGDALNILKDPLDNGAIEVTCWAGEAASIRLLPDVIVP